MEVRLLLYVIYPLRFRRHWLFATTFSTPPLWILWLFLRLAKQSCFLFLPSRPLREKPQQRSRGTKHKAALLVHTSTAPWVHGLKSTHIHTHTHTQRPCHHASVHPEKCVPEEHCVRVLDVSDEPPNSVHVLWKMSFIFCHLASYPRH